MIPDYQSIMLQLLKFAGDKKEHGFREAINYISDFFKLTEEERRIKLPSGYDIIINNRVGWARTYLKKAGLLQDPRRGYFMITNRGLDVLKENLEKINVQFLMKFPEFVEFQRPSKKIPEEDDFGEAESINPEELIEMGANNIKKNLSLELLDKLEGVSPDFFEEIVVDLLKKMGYGEGEVTGGPGDGGIDGIIYQDPLRIDKIYLQAKRYAQNNQIGSNEILKFIGVLENKGANKGVFITTSSFHLNVKDVLSATRRNIVLIDGKLLVELMIEYNVGVELDKVYEVKKINSDYFEE
jgi:restriction system protein